MKINLLEKGFQKDENKPFRKRFPKKDKMKEKEMKTKIAIFEIFLIVSLSISLSWTLGMYYDTAPEVEDVLNFLTIIPSVSAQTTECCVETTNNGYCIDFPAGECDNSCDGSCQPTSCNQLTSCTVGCGFDKNEGSCTPNTPKAACDANENCELLSDPLCQGEAKCTQGCCTIGLNSNWRNSEECRIEAAAQGLVGDFDGSVESEAICIRQSSNLDEGACVFNTGEEKNDCIFTTQSNCDVGGGIFYEDKLCSNTDLNTHCEKQAIVECFPGRDEVYWFDSCGNRENIYSSNKDVSWNNGNVLEKSGSCGVGNDNSQSGSCGNCDYTLGSICGEFRFGEDKGNMEGSTCRDLNCVDSKGTQRINGESWCVYDGPIGEGSIFNSGGSGGLLGGLAGELALLSTDLVGSRHFRQICSNGEVDVEACGDYRKEICVQNEKTLDNGVKIDEAMCRVNLWDQCIGYNDDKGCEAGCAAQCINNPDCRFHPVYVDSEFKFNACVPKYPPGFELNGIGGSITNLIQSEVGNAIGDLGGIGSAASSIAGQFSQDQGIEGTDICSLGSNTCAVQYTKSCLKGGWSCTKNCQCETISFTAQMSNLCVSLGDCGIYPNIAGATGFLGASISKKGSKGISPPPVLLMAPIYILLVNILGARPPSGGAYSDEGDILKMAAVGIGDVMGNGYARNTPGGISARGIGGGSLGTQVGAGVFGAAAGTAATAVIPGAAVGAAGAAEAIGACTASGLCINPIAIVVVIIIVAITVIAGCGKVETVEIQYQCKQWDQPFISQCELCNEDPLKPCSEYRCESLGTRCQFINEGSDGLEKCITVDGEDTLPVITPWEDALNKTYFRYEEISTNGFKIRDKDGECIDPFLYFTWGVETDVYAVCKLDMEPKEFNEMQYDFLPGKGFVKNHTMVTGLPSVDSIIAEETFPGEEVDQEITDLVLEGVGDINLYVKCANLDGNANDQEFRVNLCVNPGPDLEDPVVLATSPPDKSLIKFEAIEQEAALFISEPSECRWSSTQINNDHSVETFNALENEMECVTDADLRTAVGWACTTTLPITELENKFYVVCQDQPWLEGGSKEDERRVGNVFEYGLLRSETPLTIDSVSPSGDVVAGGEPIRVELKVETSGGGYSGVSECKYVFEEQGFRDRFLETNSASHRHILTQMTTGDYSVDISCKDNAGNVAEATSDFSLKLDTVEPQVTRVFGSGGNIVLTTNEPSRCFYNESISNCGFTSENSIEFNGANTQLLSTPLIEDVTYYIRCEDVWGKQPDACSLVVKNYENLGF